MDGSCVAEDYVEQPCSLSQRVALFNKISNTHQQKQATNPFSQNKSVQNLEKRRFSKEEYGRPEKGSLSESRSYKANINIYKEILELCEIIDKCGVPLNPGRTGAFKVIEFGELFDIYTVISNKLVGVLLRARKHQIVNFEGEVLFQRRDDHVPIYLMQPLQEVRNMFNAKIREAEETIRASAPELLFEDQDQQDQQNLS